MASYLKLKRNTKILATVGPVSDSIETLGTLIDTGVDAFRLNFSHGTHDYHKGVIEKIRSVSEAKGVPIAILADLQGPKLRVGEFEGGSVELKSGQIYTLTSEECPCTADRAYVSYPLLATDIKSGDRILLDDGLLEMKALTTDGKSDVRCEVITGGILKNRKGVNLPDTVTTISSLTDKDIRDLYFCIGMEVDYIALSFVRTANDVKSLRRLIHETGSIVPVVAKIEKPEAIENIDEIISASHAIMIARGDLGVELSSEMVPVLQKQIIRKCNAAGKPVITATQMLESMIQNPRPTRAETTDVANAILDGTDAIMLSGETAAGKYPVEAVSMMTKIAAQVEPHYRRTEQRAQPNSLFPIAEAVTQGAVRSAEEFEAATIISFTTKGSTALLLSKYRPRARILAFSSRPDTVRRLNLVWGVRAWGLEHLPSFDEMIMRAEAVLVEHDLAKTRDYIVVCWGATGKGTGTTDSMRIHQILPKNDIETETHTASRDGANFQISLNQAACIHCGVCVDVCPSEIFSVGRASAIINAGNVKNCYLDYECVNSCPVHAINIKLISSS